MADEDCYLKTPGLDALVSPSLDFEPFALYDRVPSPLLPIKRSLVESECSDGTNLLIDTINAQSNDEAIKPTTRSFSSKPLSPRHVCERFQNEHLSPESKAHRMGPYKSSAQAEAAAKRTWGSGWLVFPTYSQSTHINLPPIWTALQWQWAYKHVQGFDPEKCNDLEKEFNTPNCRNCLSNYTLCRIRFASTPFWQPFCRRCAHLMAPKVPFDPKTFVTEVYDALTGHSYVCNNCE